MRVILVLLCSVLWVGCAGDLLKDRGSDEDSWAGWDTGGSDESGTSDGSADFTDDDVESFGDDTSSGTDGGSDGGGFDEGGSVTGADGLEPYYVVIYDQSSQDCEPKGMEVDALTLFDVDGHVHQASNCTILFQCGGDEPVVWSSSATEDSDGVGAPLDLNALVCEFPVPLPGGLLTMELLNPLDELGVYLCNDTQTHCSETTVVPLGEGSGVIVLGVDDFGPLQPQ